MKTIKINENYKTRDGRKVNIIGIGSDKLHPIVGEVINDNGSIELEQWTLNGKYMLPEDGGDVACGYDLVEIIEEIALRRENLSIRVTKNKIYFRENRYEFSISPTFLKEISTAHDNITQ